MNLSNEQKALIAKWINDGSKLAEIQTRLAEQGLKLTYMEVRFLVDDLKLLPKDPEPAVNSSPDQGTPKVEPKPTAQREQEIVPSSSPSLGEVSVSVDQIARPGALVSGHVTFSDGQKAEWTLDQMGRLGLAPEQKGYRPPSADVERFQTALQKELARMGF